MLCNIYTPGYLLASCISEMVVIPGEYGQVSILPMHSPFLTLIKTGIIEITTGKMKQRYFVFRGVVEVNHKEVRILSDFVSDIRFVDNIESLGKKISILEQKENKNEKEILYYKELLGFLKKNKHK